MGFIGGHSNCFKWLKFENYSEFNLKKQGMDSESLSDFIKYLWKN